MPLIYVVEDDASVRELICYALRAADFEVEAFERGEDFLAALGEADGGQVVLLDIMLPGMDGLAVLKELKLRGVKTPVIFLTARNTELDKVTGLDLGADDYIAKPFGVLELIARVKTALRRTREEGEEQYEAGGIRMDVPMRKVYVDGKEVELTFKEFEMLRYFMKNAGIVLTRDSFLSAIWGVDTAIETRTVDMHVKTLRAKLGSESERIKTVRGVGYQFKAR